MRGVHAARALLELLCAAMVCQPAAGLTAREILDQARVLDETTRNWLDRSQHMTMTIYAATGGERHRDLRVYAKRDGNGEEKAISFFLSPPEVQGIAFLQWAHTDRDDEQWLYLPEFRRTRKIATGMRSESFVGTDFSYRDLEMIPEFLRWSETDAPATRVGEAAYGGGIADIIELRPQLESMPYLRIVAWMDRDQLVPRKLDFYDAEGLHVKVLTLDDIRDVGTIPTAHRLEMRTLTKGSRTLVELPDVRYNTGLADALFTQRHLERGPP